MNYFGRFKPKLYIVNMLKTMGILTAINCSKAFENRNIVIIIQLLFDNLSNAIQTSSLKRIIYLSCKSERDACAFLITFNYEI